MQNISTSSNTFLISPIRKRTKTTVRPNLNLIREFRNLSLEEARLRATNRECRVHAAYVYPQLFVERYLLDPNSMSPLQPHHVRLLNLIPYDKTGVRVNVQAPRGSAKTTCCAVWYPLWRICFKAFQLAEGVPDEKFILIISRNERMAQKILRDIKGLTDYPTIVEDFGILRGSVWKTDECETANGVTLQPLGRNQSPRGALVHGKRPSLVIVDDLEDLERCMNPKLRQNDWEWLFSDVMFTSDIGGNLNCIYSDTVKHPDSLSVRLTKTPGWTNVHFKAILEPEDLFHPTHEYLWTEWEGIFGDLTLDDAEREAKANAFYNANAEEMNSGVIELWPDALSYLQVRKLVVERGYHFCLRELQNIARDPSMSLFDMENAMRFKLTQDGLLRADKRIVKWSQIGGFTTYLDTMGGRDAQQNSYACAVVVAWEPLPGGHKLNPDSLVGINAYVLFCWMARKGLTEQFENAMLLHQRADAIISSAVPASHFVAEMPPDKDYTIVRAYDAAFKALKEKLKFEKTLGYHSQTQNKEERIATLEPAIKNGWLAFNEVGLPPEFWKQFREFPTSEHDDAPDAVQGACRARISTTPQERQRKREREHWQREYVTRTVRL